MVDIGQRRLEENITVGMGQKSSIAINSIIHGSSFCGLNLVSVIGKGKTIPVTGREGP
jgi:hypothetical protein